MVAGTLHSRSLVVCLLAAVFAVIALMPACVTPARAWGNGGYSADPENPDYGTHDWIAEEALEIQNWWDTIFPSDSYRTQFLLGTEAPDNPAYIGDSLTTHHLYYYSDETLQDDHAAVRALAMYDAALEALVVDWDRETGAFYAGAMTHYIADCGAFGHTMDDVTDWGNEAHHTDYEDWFDDNLATFSSPSGITLKHDEADDCAEKLAYTVTFGDGDIKDNVWMDDNYDWSDPVFKASAMASLNETVEMVAAALNCLLLETLILIPEFGDVVVVVFAMVILVALVSVARRRKRAA